MIHFLRERAGADRVLGLGYILTPNSPLIWSLLDFQSDEIVRPARPWTLLREIENRRPYGDYILLENTASSLIDLYGVRYIVGGPQPDRPSFRPVFQQLRPAAPGRLPEVAFAVYENPTALPRAFVVGRAQVVKDPAEALAAVRAWRRPDWRPETTAANVSAGTADRPQPFF